MNNRYTIAEYNRMMDEARRRAAQLRRDAISDFWRRALRSAQRLAGSLARHTGLRGPRGV